jgi:hypothetical protein
MKPKKAFDARKLFQFSHSRKSVLILQPLSLFSACAAIQQLARVGVSLMVLCAKKTQLAQPLSCTKRAAAARKNAFRLRLRASSWMQ